LATAIDRLIELDEQESAKQKERLAYLSMMDSVIEALPDALIATDSAGKIFLFNEKAEFMFGLHRSELIGESVERLLPERCRVRHAHDRDMYNRFGISRRTRTMGVGMDLVGIRSDGCEFPVEITLARMVAPQGIIDLALVRFSPRAAALAEMEPDTAEPEPVPMQEFEEPDAER
jgi:PAS domain S-box-containing protein